MSKFKFQINVKVHNLTFGIHLTFVLWHLDSDF